MTSVTSLVSGWVVVMLLLVDESSKFLAMSLDSKSAGGVGLKLLTTTKSDCLGEQVISQRKALNISVTSVKIIESFLGFLFNYL